MAAATAAGAAAADAQPAPNAAAFTAVAPDCAGPQRWPAMAALVRLKNEGVTDPADVDPVQTRVVRIASERIGPDRWRQVHDVVYQERSGRSIEVMTVNDASLQECSLGPVQVFLVSKSF